MGKVQNEINQHSEDHCLLDQFSKLKLDLSSVTSISLCVVGGGEEHEPKLATVTAVNRDSPPHHKDR
jgi:hypothetical protein